MSKGDIYGNPSDEVPAQATRVSNEAIGWLEKQTNKGDINGEADSRAKADLDMPSKGVS
jgi:hypothetical protein